MSGREAGCRGTWLLIAALLPGAGCTGSGGPPPIAPGTPCAACGMEVQDLRFACERRAGRGWRVYDAIECLTRDAGNAATPGGTGNAWLADYDSRTLHAADSLWVVRGAFASPMGGGFAAFRHRAAADSVAAMTNGRVDRLATFMAGPIGPTP
jgi:hypothetical protein